MDERARKLHQEAIVVDAHNQLMIDFCRRKHRGDQNIFSTVYAPMARKGGVDVIDLVVGGSEACLSNITDHIAWGVFALIDMLREEAKASEDLRICRHRKDIDDTLAEGKIAILMKLEGSRSIEGKPDLDSMAMLRTFYELGVRGICLVGAGRHRVGDGIGELAAHAGLTTFGVKVIQEMNRLGMLVDVAHMADHMFYDVLEASSKPIIDSHTAASALCDHIRNVDDARIKAVAQNGGVIGVIFIRSMLRESSFQPGLPCNEDDLARHIEHIAEVAGIDHVALGPDIDEFELVQNIHECWSPAPGFIEGMETGIPPHSLILDGPSSMEKYLLVTEALVRRGFSDEDIRKVLGGNMLRLYQEVLG